MNTTWVIIVFFLSLVFLLLGIIKLKMDSGMMMLLTALLMGILLGMPAAELVSTTATGFGNMMASLGIVVGLGSILGSILSESGATDQLALGLVKTVKQTRNAGFERDRLSGIHPCVYGTGIYHSESHLHHPCETY